MPNGLASALAAVAANVEIKAAPIAAAKGVLLIFFILTPKYYYKYSIGKVYRIELSYQRRMNNE
jgi:hypothetical protein